ncbi:MAG TPA: tRNA (adenosine(37)-N6)-threonylcarbamoyltransferase complex ATPase subunit type 1 TsaE [Candidatus Paceibacterota bacterium]|nr:tRNA (adenosine(37)-N6)-threonylcarbamoyltransferase complex ATPase subunit type 1 TsaE [Candidatus Paceibacterota bacterium]
MKIEFNKEKIKEISKKILDKAIKESSKNKTAKVLAFSGDLGAGKTTIVKEIAKLLGIKENIISPTFVIMKIYKINPKSSYFSNFKKLVHIDAYRLESYKEMQKIGWEELEKDKDNLIIIEWPEKVKEIISNKSFKIELSHIDEENRSIKF